MNICAFDLSACYWQAVHATAGQHVDAAFDRTVGRVCAFADHYDRLLVCVDSPPSFRIELDVGYKANRPAKEPAQVAQLLRVIANLKERGFRVLATPTYEADDVIATVAKWARENGHELMIASSDKDLFQLVGGSVRMHRLSSDKIFDAAAVKAELGVGPELVGDYLALVGDTSDNIKGIPGIGPKRAVELLTKFGSLSELVRRADEIESERIRGALLDNLVTLDLAVRLVTLRDDAPVFKTSATASVAAPRDASHPAAVGSGLDHAPGHGAEEPGTLSEVASPTPGTSSDFRSTHTQEVTEQGQRQGTDADGVPHPAASAIGLDARAEEPKSPSTFQDVFAEREGRVEESNQFESSLIKASPGIGKLAEALAKAQGQIGHAKKESVNPQFARGAGSGKYADLASVLDACREALSANGLAVIQSLRLVDKTVPRHRLTTLLLHSSGQWLSSECGVMARDDSPQGFGSALTYARRYALSALVGVAQDDDDAETAHGRGRSAT